MTATDSAGSTGLARRMAPLLAAMFGGFLSVGLPLPGLPLLITRHLGDGTALAGLAVGLQSLATVLTRLPAGRSVDRRGAKPTLRDGLLVACGAGLVTLLAVRAAPGPTPELLGLLAGRLLLGIGESLLITGVLSWAMDRAGPNRAGRAIAWNGMAQYAALALGAPAGFALYRGFGFAAVAAAGSLAPLLGLLAIARLPAPPAAGARETVALGPLFRRVLRPGLGLLAAGIGFAAVGAFASLVFVHRGWHGAGWALSAFGACFVAVRIAGAGWPDRFGGRMVAAGSMAVAAAGQALLFAAAAPLPALLGAALTGAGCSLVFPALGVEAFRGVPPAQRGSAVGLFAAFQDIALGTTGPLLGALAAFAALPAIPFACGAAAALAGALLSLGLPRR